MSYCINHPFCHCREVVLSLVALKELWVFVCILYTEGHSSHCIITHPTRHQKEHNKCSTYFPMSMTLVWCIVLTFLLLYSSKCPLERRIAEMDIVQFSFVDMYQWTFQIMNARNMHFNSLAKLNSINICTQHPRIFAQQRQHDIEPPEHQCVHASLPAK